MQRILKLQICERARVGYQLLHYYSNQFSCALRISDNFLENHFESLSLSPYFVPSISFTHPVIQFPPYQLAAIELISCPSPNMGLRLTRLQLTEQIQQNIRLVANCLTICVYYATKAQLMRIVLRCLLSSLTNDDNFGGLKSSGFLHPTILLAVHPLWIQGASRLKNFYQR